MPNWGLLGAVGEGLKSGVESYRTERDYQTKKALEEQDRKLKDRMYQADLLNKGLLESPEGGLIRSPETLLEQQAKIRSLNAKAASDEADAAGGGMKGLDRDVKTLQRDKLRQEMGITKAPPHLKYDKMPTEAKIKVGFAVNALAALTQMEDAMADGGGPEHIDVNTPILGRMKSDTPFTAAQRIAGEEVGRIQSGGVISPAEMAQFNAMGPRPGDTPEMQQKKLANQRVYIETKLRALGVDPADLPQVANMDIERLGYGKNAQERLQARNLEKKQQSDGRGLLGPRKETVAGGLVKKPKMVRVKFDDGSSEVMTEEAAKQQYGY